MGTSERESRKVYFGPYSRPNYTMVPDELFDTQLAFLSGAELKVLLYIIRRTLGFKKESDAISLNQICAGITTQGGKILDHGTGLSKRHAIYAMKSLVDMGLIHAESRSSPERGYQPTVYRLNVKNEILTPLVTKGNKGGDKREQGLVTKGNKGGDKREQGLVTKGNIQETALQETVRQKTVLQKTASSSPSEEEEKNAAAAVILKSLLDFGISKTISLKLAASYPEEYILRKLDLAQWLVKTGSPLVAKNPAGWLRRAIEDDYQAPPQYKSPEQRTKEEQRLQAEQQQRQAAEKEYRRVKEEAQRRIQEQHPPQPIEGTELTTESAWNQVLENLKNHKDVSQATFHTWLKDTSFLWMEGNTAIVNTTSHLAIEWLERRMYRLMVGTLRKVLGRDDIDIQLVAPP